MLHSLATGQPLGLRLTDTGPVRMRVLLSGHSYIVGFNQKKVDMLAQAGVEMALLVPSNWKNIGGLFDGHPCPVEKGFDSFRIFSGPVIRPGHIASFLFRPGVVGGALREFMPDLVQIEQEAYSFASAQISRLARATGKKTVLFSWENLDRRIHLLQRIARWNALRNLDGIISGNTAGVDLVRKWGFRGAMTVIPQVGVDTGVFSPRQPGAGRRFTVGFVGRLVPEKGVDTLIKAVASLVQQGRDVGLLICGAGPEQERLAQQAEGSGIAGRVEWCGSVPHAQVPDVMARMDALVLPSVRIESWAEQFGLVLPQAMAIGIPVLGSDSGAIPEVIGRSDVIFPERDAAALAGMLAALIADPARRAELRSHGTGRVHSLYSKERVAERTVEFWRQLTQTPTSA
jgi:glycosyltransferase involved in cell wall biosynthesis